MLAERPPCARAHAEPWRILHVLRDVSSPSVTREPRAGRGFKPSKPGCVAWLIPNPLVHQPRPLRASSVASTAQ